jgi:hypothetical protein
MAEKLILVCDLDGRPAVGQALVQLNGKRFVLDLCSAHAREFESKGRAPRRGRKPSQLSSGPTRRRATATKPAARKRQAKKSTPKRKSTAKRKST